MLDAQLKPSFRYVHEPLSASEDALPELGSEQLKAELRSRLLHSRGGTFLITGFRGVGKTTLVKRTLDEIVAHSAPSELVLPVYISVARSTSTEKLLFAIVRRVFEALNDSGIFARLSPQVRNALLVAYMRTSLSFKQSQSEALQKSIGVELGPGSSRSMAAITDFVLPKISFSGQRNQSLATEAAFLAYSETDAEHDLMRIVAMVSHELVMAARRKFTLRWLWRRPAKQPSHLRLVVILDEVDKLTGGEGGLAVIDDLLGGMKNVLTTSGAHFLVVAGPDLHDRAVRDTARGNGVYESVFGWRIYVPCSWNAAEVLVADSVTPGADTGNDQLQLLTQYLRFKGRGVLRRLLVEFNDFVEWNERGPALRIDAAGVERVKFYARLEEILREYFDQGRGYLFPVAIDEDRWRLSGYHIVDWVIQSRDPFSAADVIRDDGEASLNPLLRISRRNVDNLLDHLAERGILEIIRDNNPNQTIIGDIPESRDKIYRLAEDVRAALYGFAVQHESERASADISLVVPVATPQEQPGLTSPQLRAAGPPRVIGDRYELLELVGQGGMGSVYAAEDRLTGQRVAVKVLLSSMKDNPQAQARIRREAEIATQLAHPHVVQAHGMIESPDGSPALIMELLEGSTLSQVVQSGGPLSPEATADVGHALAEGLTYLANKKVIRLDLKPGNIILHPQRGPVIIDLGIAKPVEPDTTITGIGGFVGTPMYMAPEVIQGDLADERADLYSLGLVLYYCLVGRSPWEGKEGLGLMRAIMSTAEVPLDALRVSPEFRAVLSRVLVADITKRFVDASSFRVALEKTPEWRAASDEPAPSIAPIIDSGSVETVVRSRS